MNIYKKLVSFSLIATICITLFTPFLISKRVEADSNNDLVETFDEYGVKTNKNLSSRSSWITFPPKSNVPLDKTWNVKFSSEVSLEKIDAIVIQRGNEFVPVKITLSSGNEAQISSTDGFSGDTTYDMKIFLENGNKYKMSFTTISDYRNIDVEPNDSHVQASEMYLNETILGNIKPKSDERDFYKIVLPEDGTLNLQATELGGGYLNMTLYGVNGRDGRAIGESKEKTTGNINIGLEKGIYYVEIKGHIKYGDYTLSNTFSRQVVTDDNASSNYINANQIKLNSFIEGHIGYTNTHNSVNDNDFYKIVLPKKGVLSLEATHLGGKAFSMMLYGSNGDDSRYITRSVEKSKANIDVELEKGTYYVHIKKHIYYGGYKMTNTFK